VRLPIVKDRLGEQIKAHDRRAAFRIEEAQRRASVVGHPAPRWEAADLNGHVHSIDEFRGKVVILDFFTRGCGCCTMTMPQIKQLAAEFQDQSVVVLGMFFGEDSDARFDVDKLGINFLTLKVDKELLAKYRVTGIPTFVIIDQKGIVQDMRFGYTPTLQNDLGETARELLTKP
jgi:thiol-disulfide isomerase/thioredoxin